ncbi:MAG TPA: hypothetical protein VHB49_06210 [Bradyrhizobium sp.]|nr:hypothetical protein [Bradyrhizobium sp.]
MTLLVGVTPSADARGPSGLLRRVSCTMVRFYVARYSEAAAEMWARSHGASDADIAAARRCLAEGPIRTAQAGH